MRFLLPIAAALVALGATPSVHAATGDSVTTVELKRIGSRTFEPRGAVSRFTLAGIHWRGSGRVVFRTRSHDGRWSPWRAAAPEAEDGPDPSSPERAQDGWRIGNPWWTGESDRIQARVTGRVARLRAHLVWSPETLIPLRAPTATTTPPIVPRSSWGADEKIRRGPPVYASAVRFAIVHHTAGRNGYSRAEAAAIVKGIQLFHVQGNGWNDIGYNFLVDRFGTIYEGRYGGIDRNVVGAHAQGFNTGSVGIALLGNYEGVSPAPAAQDAIARLIAWRLDLAHADPTAFLTFLSGGSDRYASGVPVLLNGVSGHRDTGFTACPGDLLYGRLGSIAAAARANGRAQDLRPEGDGERIVGPRQRSALAGAELVGGVQDLRGRRGRSWGRHRDGRRLDVAVGRRSGRPVHVDDLGRSCAAGLGNAASRRRAAASGDRDTGRRTRGDQPERRRPGRHDDADLRGSRPPRTSPSRSRMLSAVSSRPRSTASGRLRGDIRSSSTLTRFPTARTTSWPPPGRRPAFRFRRWLR